jgi:hypothetical protein
MSKPIDYLEVNSAYRNRNLWPQAGEFDFVMSQNGSNNKATAVDPVSDSAPQKVWNNAFRYTYNAIPEMSQITNISIVANVLGPPDFSSLSDPLNLEISVQNSGTGQIFRPEDNFYDGAILAFGDVRRRIILYKFVSTSTTEDIAIIRVSSAFPDSVMSLSNGIIGDPTIYRTASYTISTPLIFIPYGEDIENFYINSTIQDVYTGMSRRIIAYSAVTHCATLEYDGGFFSYTVDKNRNYVLRTTPPILSGRGNPNPQLLQGVNGIWLGLQPNASNIDGIYSGDFLRIATADITTVVRSGEPPSAPTDEVRRIKKYIALSTISPSAIVSGTNTFTFGTNANRTADYYIGAFLQVRNSSDPSKTFQIATYNSTTLTGTLTSNFTYNVPIGGEIEIRSVQIERSFSVTPTIQYGGYGAITEVMQFTRDNWNPFSYSGSTFSSDQEVCYEMRLENLILPNVVLNVARGGRVVFYPHVYVEMTELSAPTLGRLYSNNPYTNKVLFRMIVSDMTDPLISPFVRFKTDGMVQTIKCKPNSNFHFAVRMPDGGQVFSVSAVEDFSPRIPNALIQITAMFSLKRL